MPVTPGNCIPSGSGPGTCSCQMHDDECLQDDNGIFYRRSTNDGSGVIVTSFVDTSGAPYTPVGVIGPCCCGGPNTDDECLTDDNGVFYRRTTTDEDGNVTVTYVDVSGAPYTPVGTVMPCDTQDIAVQKQVLCEEVDGEQVKFERHWVYTAGALTSTFDTDFDGNPYTVTGPVSACEEPCCPIVLATGCWDDGTASGEWVAVQQSDGTVTVTDVATNDPVDPTDVVPCPSDKLVQKQVICDDDGAGNVTPFERHFVYNLDGTLDSTFDTDADGNPYTVVGTATICPAPESNAIVQKQVLCDDDGSGTAVQFERHFVYNADGTLASTYDTDANGDPYTLVGEAVICEEVCCPIVLATGCWDDGTTTGEWTSVQQPDGTVEVLDVATGDPVDPADIIPCPVDPTVTNAIVQKQVLCDNVNGTVTEFERHFVYNPDGTLASTYDTDVDGAPYAVQGTVEVCSEPCCPRKISEGCYDDGSGLATWISVLNPDSTIVIFDPQTGGNVDPADMVQCPDTGDGGTGTTTPNPATSYQTSITNVQGSPQTFTPNGDLVAWSVRNRTATSQTATVQVNGGPNSTLFTNEGVSAALSGPESNDVLDDTITVNPGNGIVRVVLTRRV